MNKTDYSSRDANATIGMCGAVAFRKGLSRALCSRYWRDVHGTLGGRTAGLTHLYRQHHLDRCAGGIWPTAGSIEYNCAEQGQIDGLAETTFLDEQSHHRYRDSPILSLLLDDEQYCFRRAVIYQTTQGHSRTYVDAIEDGAPNGKPHFITLIVFVKKREKVGLAEFRSYMADQFAPAMADHHLTLKSRLHLLEPHRPPAHPSPKVDRHSPAEKQYHAIFEIAFKHRLDLNRFFDSEEYLATVEGQQQNLGTIHVFPRREVYTLVYDGTPTLAGQRSFAVADAILRIGAVNRLTDHVD